MWKKSAPNHPGKPLHPPAPPYGQCPYGNNTFQKGASLTAAPSVHLEVGSPGFLPGTQRPAFPMWRRGTVASQVTHHSLFQQLACIVYIAPAQVIFIYKVPRVEGEEGVEVKLSGRLLLSSLLSLGAISRPHFCSLL